MAPSWLQGGGGMGGVVEGAVYLQQFLSSELGGGSREMRTGEGEGVVEREGRRRGRDPVPK